MSYITSLPHPSPHLLPYTTLFRSIGILTITILPLCNLATAQDLTDEIRQEQSKARQQQRLEQLRRQEQIKQLQRDQDRKSTRLNSSHSQISYAVFCLKKKKEETRSESSLLGRTRLLRAVRARVVALRRPPDLARRGAHRRPPPSRRSQPRLYRAADPS